MPNVQKRQDLAVGGQAVPGGVAILTDERHVVAVRDPEGTIQLRVHPRPPAPAGFTQLPVVRGVVALGRSLRLGMGSIRWAIRILSPHDLSATGPGLALSTAIAVVIAIGLFVLAPAAAGEWVGHRYGSPALAEAVLRVAVFLAYVVAVSRLAAVQEVFRYHGAEHRAVAAYEHGLPLEVDAARTLPIHHPRCGTNFLLLVLLVSSGLFALLPESGVLVDGAARVVLLPLAVGLTYEAQRWAARHPGSRAGRALLRPGMALQRLTTAEPDDRQLEVALVAVAVATGIEPVTSGPDVASEPERAPAPV